MLTQPPLQTPLASMPENAAKPQAPAASLHIGQLQLHGLSLGRREQRQLQAALMQELQRVFADPRLATALAGGGALPSLQLPPLQLEKALPAGELGCRIARALGQGLLEPRA